MPISSSSVSTSAWGIVRFNRRDRISTRAEADDQIRRRIIDLAEKAVLWFECAGYEALLLQPKNRAASIDLSRIDRDGCCDRLCIMSPPNDEIDEIATPCRRMAKTSYWP